MSDEESKMRIVKHIQFSIFNDDFSKKSIKQTRKLNNQENNVEEEMFKRLERYDLKMYIADVKELGLEKTWENICNYIINNGENKGLLNIKRFGELYEIGLAVQDKIHKRESGQYYTPDDVALLMSQWLDSCEGENVCDVACGTGKLILTYLDYIGYERAKKIISEGKLYLYDLDNIALKICKTSLLIKYGLDLDDKIHDIYGDFLSYKISLPFNCKTISNPPYAAIKQFNNEWDITDVLNDTHEMYSAFMEKIFQQSKSTVIITPFSFISGDKYYSLRKRMCEVGNGFIVSFDNVPGSIFYGKKHGIFNTNTVNSVRAAITVQKSDQIKGYRVSPLIRFKNRERAQLLKPDILEKTLPESLQIIDNKNKAFEKVFKHLNGLFNDWKKKSEFVVKDLISSETSKFLIDMPNTCRYNTTASSRKLSRTGSITMNVLDEDSFNFLYCFINSSFTYWWWRIYDGGITYPVGLLYKMPVPFNLLSEDDKEFFKKICKEMCRAEKKYIVTKVNAGVKQENIKFPDSYRNKINKRLIKILNHDDDSSIFNVIHDNKFF